MFAHNARPGALSIMGLAPSKGRGGRRSRLALPGPVAQRPRHGHDALYIQRFKPVILCSETHEEFGLIGGSPVRNDNNRGKSRVFSPYSQKILNAKTRQAGPRKNNARSGLANEDGSALEIFRNAKFISGITQGRKDRGHGLSGGEKAGVLSTLCSEVSDTDYGYMQGTSMSCPHMSGVAALGLSYALAKGKRFTREEFISMLLTSVNDIDSQLEGTKTSSGKLNLENYRGKMGTGLVDAYQLLMQIEGTPCLKVRTGKLELITLTKHFGGSAQNLTYTGVEVSAADMQKLGMEAAPKMYNGQLMIKCTKPGVAHVTVKAIAGGNRPGSETVMGGIKISKEFAVIARETGAENGGWL